MKTFLVINPSSANGLTGRRWAELEGQASRALGDFGHAFTRGPMDAAKLTTRALKEGYECIVAVGGDGTVNEVVNGLFEPGAPGKLLNPDACLGVWPRGTGGDFRRTFGWDTDTGKALARIGGTGSKMLDIGVLEYTTPLGATALRYFANICSFGVSGLVDKEVNQGSKALGGKLSFMVGSLRALLKYQDRKVRLTLDDRPPEDVKVTTLAVAIGRYFGGGMCIAPNADPCDGIFDLTILTGFGLLDFALKSKALYDGTHTRLAGSRSLRARKVRAESRDEVLLDVDGEQPGRLPCSMTLLPGAVRLKV